MYRDNPDQLSLVSTETKISEVQLQLLIKSIRIPRFTKDSDESSPLRIAS